jgi:hypothetical protein
VVGDQHREIRFRHNGPQPRFACRHRCGAEEVGIFPFRILPQQYDPGVRALAAWLPESLVDYCRKEGAGNVRCFATPTASHAELRSMRASLATGTPLPPAFPARWFDGLVMMRWGMPPPPRAGGFPVTNIRNTTSPHWRGWLKPESRCLVPANSFAEYAPEPNPETKKKDVVWFALNDDRPLFTFAGIWTEFKGDRGTKSKPIPGPHLIYGFLTTTPNAVVEPIHPKAMPVILTTPEECGMWMRTP